MGPALLEPLGALAALLPLQCLSHGHLIVKPLMLMPGGSAKGALVQAVGQVLWSFNLVSG